MPTAKIANSQVSDASQHNGLVDDIWDKDAGHGHTGAVAGGQKVNHGNLVDGAIPHVDGTPHTHAEIDDHIGTTTGTGSTGVHGLGSTIAVQGTHVPSPPLVFEYGHQAGEPDNAIIATTLDTIVGVIVTPDSQSDGPGAIWTENWNDAPGASTFEVHMDGWNSNHPSAYGGVSWLAWGTAS